MCTDSVLVLLEFMSTLIRGNVSIFVSDMPRCKEGNRVKGLHHLQRARLFHARGGECLCDVQHVGAGCMRFSRNRKKKKHCRTEAFLPHVVGSI